MYSDVNDNNGRRGIAIALSATANAALLEFFAPMPLLLVKIRPKGPVAADTVKDEYDADLKDSINDVPAIDILDVVWDWKIHHKVI